MKQERDDMQIDIKETEYIYLLNEKYHDYYDILENVLNDIFNFIT